MGYDKKTDTFEVRKAPGYRPGYTFYRDDKPRYIESTGSFGGDDSKEEEFIIEMPMTLVDNKDGKTMTLNGRVIKLDNDYLMKELPKFYKKLLKISKKMSKGK